MTTTKTYQLVETPGNQNIGEFSADVLDPQIRDAVAGLEVGERMTVPALADGVPMGDLSLRVTRVA